MISLREGIWRSEWEHKVLSSLWLTIVIFITFLFKRPPSAAKVNGLPHHNGRNSHPCLVNLIKHHKLLHLQRILNYSHYCQRMTKANKPQILSYHVFNCFASNLSAFILKTSLPSFAFGSADFVSLIKRSRRHDPPTRCLRRIPPHEKFNSISDMASLGDKK